MEYCTPATVKLLSNLDDGELDVGVLTLSCLDHTRTCIPDTSSSLGGRCVNNEDWLMTADYVPISYPKRISGTLDLETMSDKVSSTLEATSSTERIAGQECKLFEALAEEDPEMMGAFLYECHNPNHVCATDDSSPDGVCVDNTILYNEFEVDNNHHIRGHRRMVACNYANGTSGGMKCSGGLACAGLSPDFIANNIGCGSCNGNYGEPTEIVTKTAKQALS